MTNEIKRWGNSLALRIPKDISQTLGVTDGSQVEMNLEDGKLIIALLKRKRCWRMDLSGLKPRFRNLFQTVGTEALASAKTRKLLLIK